MLFVWKHNHCFTAAEGNQTVCLSYNTPLDIFIVSHFFSPHPEPFDEDATDTDSFPPNLPKGPTTSSLPSPVNNTLSSPTSSHGSFNTTTVTSGESCFHPTLSFLLLFTPHPTISFFPQTILSFCPLSSPTMLLYPPLLAALIPLISPSSPIVSLPVSFSPVVIRAKRGPCHNSLPLYCVT